MPGDVDHRVGRVDRRPPAHRGADPGAVAVALPVQRRLRSGRLHELGVRSVADRGSIDLEGSQLDPVAPALVVVGEAAVGGADLVGAGGDGDHLAVRRERPPRCPRAAAARSRRPSAAAAASSRCAGARGRAASRRRTLPSAADPRRRRRSRPCRAPRACARGRRPCRRAGRRRAGSAARRGSCAGSRSRRRSGRDRRASARGRRSSGPARAPRSWRCGRGPRRAG